MKKIIVIIILVSIAVLIWTGAIGFIGNWLAALLETSLAVAWILLTLGLEYIWLILFLIAMAYREVQILVDLGLWNQHHHRIKFWYIDWTSRWKNFDSFHFVHGLAIFFLTEYLVLSGVLWIYKFDFLALWITDQIFVAAYWFVFMQIRNLFIHKVFKRK